MQKPSKIECAKCHAASTLTELICSACGGRIVKHCGACDSVLSVMKKFCDSCGEPQEVVSHTPMPRPISSTPKAPAPPPRPHLEGGAKHPIRDIPHTIMRRVPEKKEAALDPIPGKISKPQPDLKIDPRLLRRKPDAAVPTRKRQTLVRTLVKERPIFSTVLGFILFIATVSLYLTFWKSRRSPERMLQRTAQAYLEALKSKHHGDAYRILSAASRRSLSLEEFEEMQETLSWNYDKLRITSLSQDRALVQYELLVSGRAVEQDWLHFILEKGKWRRMYWWHIMPEIEKKLQEEKYAAAAERAEAAANINPLDPMLPGYLCEAAYGLKQFAQAESFCHRALDMAKLYPSRLGADGQLHLSFILADIYRNGTKELPKAAQQYEKLLVDPLLRGRHRCDIHLANADTHFLLGAFDKTVEQLHAGAKSCRDEEESAYIQQGIRILSGTAGSQAVTMAQNHQMPGETQTLLEWRKKNHKKTSPSQNYRDIETWEASHLSGPEYSVTVRNAGAEILTAHADLWNQEIKVKIHVQ